MKAGAAVVLLVAGALVGCGLGSRTATVVRTVTVGSTTPTTEFRSEPIVDGDCTALGIDRKAGNEGRCTSDGQRFAVANRTSELRLETISVELEKVWTARSITDSHGDTATADDIFVVVQLTVGNRSSEPRLFDTGGGSQVRLMIDDKVFTPDIHAQNGYDEQAFLWQGKDVHPGAAQTGDVVFDVPEHIARQIDRSGELHVLDFGQSFGLFDPNDAELGVIRLWK